MEALYIAIAVLFEYNKLKEISEPFSVHSLELQPIQLNHRLTIMQNFEFYLHSKRFIVFVFVMSVTGNGL